ncbi:MAG: AI-2E family transporter [Xanthomonadales bacterium]|nr:AI-2E family transporter [Xanthomonadales bacterium]
MKRAQQAWFVLAVVALLGWLTWLLAPVLTPFAISAALAYFGDPLVDRLERVSLGRWQFGRTLAVVLVFLLMALVFMVVLLVVVPLLVDQARQLAERLPAWIDWLSETAVPWLAVQVGMDISAFEPGELTVLLKSYWKEISGAALSVAGTLGRGGQAVLTWLTNLVLIPVVTFYLMRDWDKLIAGIQDLLPRNMVGGVSRLAGEIDEVLGAFVRGQLMVMLALGLIYWAGLELVGIEMAFLIGMGAGLLSIVPYLGSIVGLVAAAAAALFQFQDLLHLLLVGAVFTAGQLAEGMLLTPRLVGDRIGLHPVAVIFAVLAGGQLFGFLGILLALPAAAALNVVVRHARESYTASSLFGPEHQEGADR